MTTTQICALIIAILFIGLTYYAGYRGGLSDGRAEGHLEGIEEGKAIQHSDDHGMLRDLQLLLDQARENHDKLYVYYQRALGTSKLGNDERATLLATAKQLQLAADTFLALKAPTKATTARALRTKILAIAERLEQDKQEAAA
ncbi:hypothetical protein [Pseudomonas gingeri]|uniref:hypothetical protein n=1 Tax=Pseudomonas gingeri TaxID=117681 RepID=UPI0015A26060|nr:hypothetical protein [Pseudomonas gingeri]NWD04073.1 hypothetical protein [Pseudomonas gingeri]NWE33871.1 hypothetical protein [Pseudomonas gingeri]NWE58043.1 hypothetical protein [Pseudomonas gingeri]NWF04402.1 hypothetical protein [Pseudomonas gingeri]